MTTAELPVRNLAKLDSGSAGAIRPDETYTDAVADNSDDTYIELVHGTGYDRTIIRGQVDGSALPASAQITGASWRVRYHHFDVDADAVGLAFYSGPFGVRDILKLSPTLPATPDYSWAGYDFGEHDAAELPTAADLSAGGYWVEMEKQETTAAWNVTSEYWVSEASLLVTYEAGAVLPPLRQFPRDDELGTASARRIWPSSSQQASLRRLGYY